MWDHPPYPLPRAADGGPSALPPPLGAADAGPSALPSVGREPTARRTSGTWKELP
jgi:hypothetical protein